MRFSLSMFANAFSDRNGSGSPSLSNFKWNRDLTSFPIQQANSNQYSLAPGQSQAVFTGVRSITQDNTTTYSIAPVPGSTVLYSLTATGGLLPNFRTPRVIGTDATSQFLVVQNGPITTFTSSGGAIASFSGISVGDQVSIGSQFNAANQGTYQVIANTATSFTIENLLGASEGPITLGSSFASQIAIFSAFGVQISDALMLSSGFSLATLGTYFVTSVFANSLQFSSASILPTESSILTEVIAYSFAKQWVYIESDAPCDILINGTDTAQVAPFIYSPNQKRNGMFMRTSPIWSLSLTNSGIVNANVLILSIE